MNVFITTCSMNKIEGGKKYKKFSWNTEKNIDLLKRRLYILKCLEERTYSSSKQPPLRGPDYGEASTEGQYWPAIRRYSEGSFVRGLIASGCSLNDWGRGNRLFFVSALYGLVHFKEPIQNYDLDLLHPGLSEQWKTDDIITRVLLRYLGNIKKISYVFYCCINKNYQDLINWGSLRDEGYEIRHSEQASNTTTSQARWTCGHMAGELKTNNLKISGSYFIYESDNGKIKISKQEGSEEHVIFYDSKDNIRIQPQKVAVAVRNESQWSAFKNHARKHGWEKFAEFIETRDLRPETISRLDNEGIRLLIIYVDEKHSNIQKYYQTKSFDIAKDIPLSWRKTKILNCSDIRWVYRPSFE